MELFLQFGHGMKKLSIELAQKWGGASVILSPRDMTPEQLPRWSQEFKKAGITCYFDPQCYFPRSEQTRLNQYSYWDRKMNTNLGSQLSCVEQQILEIKKYCDIAQARICILPGILNTYDEGWSNQFTSQLEKIINAANKVIPQENVYATIAFPSGFLVQGEGTIEPVLNFLTSLNVDGYYVIAEAIERKYLIENPMWLSNILHICATLKLNEKKVIYGYGNHQMLPLILTGVDAIASGTWLNVRSFTNRFVDQDEQKRRSTWVYYPEALSEYKLPFLDMAFNNGCLTRMKSKDTLFMNDSIRKLFQPGVSPSDTTFNESDAFYHYLCCLRHQIELLHKDSFSSTYDSYELLLVTAEREIEQLEDNGIYGQTRSFRDYIDVNRAAIKQLKRSHGFALEITWSSLSGMKSDQ